MSLFYGRNPSTSSPLIKSSSASQVLCTLVRNPDGNYSAVDENGRALGIFTKSQVIHGSQGFQRSNDFLLQDQSAKLLPKERVCNCLKKRIDKTKQREVKYNENRKKAHYANVQRCGSIWSCPVCAKQITEKRREELKRA